MNNTLLKILFIEDLPSDMELEVLELRKENLKFEHRTVCNRKDLIKALKEFKPDLIISDYKMPAFNGLQALKITKETDPDIPFIICTGSVNEEIAVECIKAGAHDYVIKEHLTRLPFAVKEALEQRSIQKEKIAADLLLKESEEKLQSIFRVAPVGIGLVINRVLFEVNDTLCSLLGYERKELIGKSSELLYPTREEYERVGREKYSQIAEKGTGSVETIFKCKNGNVLNIVLSSTPLDRNDNSRGVTFTVLDITARKRAENELTESEGRFRSIAENLSDVIFVTDIEGIIKYVSPSSNSFGYTPDELTGRFFGDILPEGELEKAMKVFINAINSINTGTSAALTFKRKDGSIFFAELTGSVFKTGDETVGILGLLRDITQRKILEAATVESEKRYRELFVNNPVPTYIFDEQSLAFIEVNKAAVENYGYSGKEFASMTLKDIRVTEDIPGLLESVKTLGKETFHSTAMRHRKKDGTTFPVEIVSHSLPEKNGRKTRLVMTTDITERVRAAEQMKIARDKAEASDKLKTTFLNNISHEVRTPLNGILGFAEIMLQDSLSEEDKKESLTMLFDSSNRLLDTINNYMDISLLTSGNFPVHRKDFIPGQMMMRIYDSFKTICSNKGLEFLLKDPEQIEYLSVISDPEIVQKILSHLLSNAIKFTEKGTIDIGYNILKKELEFFVRDTGIGIGKESITKIFERFVKEDRGPNRISEGSGLGLSIAKGLTETIGGTLRIESEIGVGSCFYFTIPLLKEDRIDFNRNSADKNKKISGKPTVLIAEDDEANFFYLNALLSHEMEVTVIHASNGREAIELFKTIPGIQLILMDIKMPVMDGLEATRQIKAINRDVPVIAITAYAMAGDEARILDAGCDQYLVKPVNKRLLLEKMAEYIAI